jgi:hypothetical protein
MHIHDHNMGKETKNIIRVHKYFPQQLLAKYSAPMKNLIIIEYIHDLYPIKGWQTLNLCG